MSTSKSRIPNTLPKFNQYILTVTNYLIQGGTPNNGQRLGLSAAQISQVQSFLAQWYTGNPASPGAYELHSDKNTKTHTTRMVVVSIMKNFSAYFRPLLMLINASPAITQTDRGVFNLPAPVSKKTKRSTPITDQVYPTMKVLGGGDMRMSCKNMASSKRAGKPPGADSVELAYKFGDPLPATPTDAGIITLFSTKAEFVLHLGPANVGKYLHLYARWYNSKYPALAGPWGGLLSIMIA
jgi:hypothetical protein